MLFDIKWKKNFTYNEFFYFYRRKNTKMLDMSFKHKNFQSVSIQSRSGSKSTNISGGELQSWFKAIANDRHFAPWI